MTIDKEKLRAQAEAATQDHGARRVEVDLNGRNVIGDGSWKIFIAWHTPDGKGKENADFCAAASPSTILALLGEIELLESYLCACPDCGGEGQVFTGSYSHYGHMDPPEPNMEKCCECDGQGFIGTPQQLHSVIVERDQLKAENEVLRREREGMALVPIVPAHGLLMSMAIRHDHGLGVPGYYDQPLMQRANHGVSHARKVESALSEMRKLHEEVVGVGFYSLAKDADYAALAKEQSNG